MVRNLAHFLKHLQALLQDADDILDLQERARVKHEAGEYVSGVRTWTRKPYEIHEFIQRENEKLEPWQT